MPLFKRHPENPNEPNRDDEVAVERYEYLLATAPPETLNRIHAEAFEKLSDGRRRLLFERLKNDAAAPEDQPVDTAPATLARVATDAETARPGTLLRILGAEPSEPGGEVSLLEPVARLAVASFTAASFLPFDLSAGTQLWAEDADEGGLEL